MWFFFAGGVAGTGFSHTMNFFIYLLLNIKKNKIKI